MLDCDELFSVVGGGCAKEPDRGIIDRLRLDDSFEVPVELTDLDLWANYVNDDLYEMDVKVREFLKRTRYSRERNGGYRTTASAVFAWIFGRRPSQSDTHVCRMLHELLKYYCTSYTGKTTYGGKKVNRVYEFSRYSGKRKRPYSLRLRLEEADGRKNPWRRSPVDDSKKRRVGRRSHSEDGS